MITVLIDANGKTPIYEQIYLHIREEIRNGTLACGEKLPSERGLAGYLNVSRNTVDLAYAQLMSEGYVESVPKKGYYVCALQNLYWEPKEEQSVDLPHEAANTVGKKEKTPEPVVDFSPSGVDMDYFPYSKWRKLMRECLIDDNKELFLGGEHQGDRELRMAIRRYLHESRGVKCDISQIVIGAGSDYMLLLLSRIMGEQKTVAMENPTYRQAYTVFRSVGYSVLPVHVDAHGMCVEELGHMQAEFVYVTPSHQFPLGTVMSANRKRQLLAWAAEREDRYIIEDDYDSEFRYLGRPIPALQSQDPFDRVIYIGTLSKVIAPAIRMSYMVLPRTCVERYRNRAGFYFSTVSRIDQRVIGQFFLQGYFERHLNRMRKIYRTKHEYLIQTLKKSGFGGQIYGESAGLHLLLSFGGVSKDAPERERMLVRRAAEQGVKVYALSDYCIAEEPRRPTVLLGFARLKETDIAEGVRRLRLAWQETRKGG